MDTSGKEALAQIDIAEAELAVLKQEGVLRHLLSTGEPTVEAVAQLARLRKAVAGLVTPSEHDLPDGEAG